MRTSHRFPRFFVAFFALLAFTTTAIAADPGSPYPITSEASDQKAGSVLIYNAYASSATCANKQDARISITNINQQADVSVHLFFVDGSSCSIADSYICLTPNQTTSFLASDIDPGINGYLVAVASDANGLPLNFNYLIGDVFVKYSTGHFANLGAVAFSKLSDTNVVSEDGLLARLNFDGLNAAGSYNRLPRMLAVDTILDRASGNDTLIILNRIGGNLATGAATLGTMFGLLYNDAETGYSFSFSGGCQFLNMCSDSFPRTAPRITTVIPEGRTGWMKLYSTNDYGILGAVINANPNACSAPGAMNGGHNMHVLTFTQAGNLLIPLFPPNC